MSSPNDYTHRIETAIERGSYRVALDLCREALAHYPQTGSLKLLRAICLEAMGRTPEAVAFVRSLLRDGDPETRKQARYLLTIWEAPRLRRPDNWTVQIPDLSHLSSGDWNLTAYAPAPKPRPASSRTDAPSRASGSHKSSLPQRVGQLVVVSSTIVFILWGFTHLGRIP